MSGRLFVLTAHDPATGWASALVGVLGVDDRGHHLSWVPYQPGAEPWRQRVATTTVTMTDAVGEWVELADGISWDLVEIEASGRDLHGDVEAAVDELLATVGDEAG